MEIFSASLALCAGNSPVTWEPHKGQWRGALMFPLISAWKRLSKQSWGWWFGTPSRSLWGHCYDWVNISTINTTHGQVLMIDTFGKCMTYYHTTFITSRWPERIKYLINYIFFQSRAHFAFLSVIMLSVIMIVMFSQYNLYSSFIVNQNGLVWIFILKHLMKLWHWSKNQLFQRFMISYLTH